MNGEGIDRSEADAIARAAADSERYERERAIDFEASDRRAEVREIHTRLVGKAPLYALDELDNQLRAEIRELRDRITTIETALLPPEYAATPPPHPADVATAKIREQRTDS